MLSKEEAIDIATQYIKANSTKYELVLLIEETKEFESGWVFFYQSRKFIESRDYRDMLGGNAPVIVNKFDGGIYVTGTSYSIEKYINDYLDAQKKR
jgi:Immunity protein 35